MSDRYEHLDALTGDWDHRQENLLTLGRYLVDHADALKAGGELGFRGWDFRGLTSPATVSAVAEVKPLPPIAFGPAAGLASMAGEDWAEYCDRVFGISADSPFLQWLQSPMWAKTDPSPEGVALRIAYALDYGVPFDHVEIAMGQAHSDYDRNGFMWERLDMLPPEGWRLSGRRLRQPDWVGAVELERRSLGAKADILLPPGEAPFSAGMPDAQIRALASRVGVLPGSFNDLLLLAGRRVGDNGVYADQLDDIRRQAHERVFAGAREGDDPVPRDAIFIGKGQGAFEFILAGPRTDSPVFRFAIDSGLVTPVAFSVFGWAEGFMRDYPQSPPDGDVVEAPAERQTLLKRLWRWFGFGG